MRVHPGPNPWSATLERDRSKIHKWGREDPGTPMLRQIFLVEQSRLSAGENCGLKAGAVAVSRHASCMHTRPDRHVHIRGCLLSLCTIRRLRQAVQSLQPAHQAYHSNHGRTSVTCQVHLPHNQMSPLTLTLTRRIAGHWTSGEAHL